MTRLVGGHAPKLGVCLPIVLPWVCSSALVGTD